MTSTQRRMQIFEIMQTEKTVEVNELAKKFDVSAMTIRRDLALFERQGLVTTNYGGAYINQGTAIEPSFSLKAGQMQQNKKNVARVAAEMVKNGDSIIIDCGTTTLQLANYIQDKRITVITNSWAIVNYLQSNNKIKLILAPGEYSETSAGVLSNMTIDFYNKFNVDTVFMGTQGFDVEKGATVPDIEDAGVKSALLEAGKKRVLLLNNEKWGDNYLIKYADVRNFDEIITDSGTDPQQVERARACGVEVIIAD